MATPIQGHLLHAFRRVLRPFITLLVRAGIAYDEFSRVVKSVFVECAAREHSRFGAVPSRARLSMITGVPRADVDRAIDVEGSLAGGVSTVGGAIGEVLQRWHTDPRYIGPYGIPLELPIKSSGQERSFTNLVSLVDPKVNAEAVLEELLRVGSITYTSGNRVRATSRSFLTPAGVSSEQLDYFVNTLSLLADTLQFNMDPKNQAKRLERFVIADRALSSETLEKFETYARERAQAFLLDLDNWLSPYTSEGALEPEGGLQTGVHVFMYIDQPPKDGTLKDLSRQLEGDTRR